MIEIRNLYFTYGRELPNILNNLNLSIRSGDYISFLGDNGCGKSTLVKIILKLLKPTQGSVLLKSNKIGYVPQRLDNLNTQFPLSVFEMLDSYRKIHQFKNKERVHDYLEMVRMEDFKNELIGNLSGGQSQKVFIARALMGNPDILILDEPSNGIDIGSQEEIYYLIKSLNKNQGMTVISVEHNLKAAISNSSLIYHLSQGKGHVCQPKNYIKEYVKTNTGGSLNASI